MRQEFGRGPALLTKAAPIGWEIARFHAARSVARDTQMHPALQGTVGAVRRRRLRSGSVLLWRQRFQTVQRCSRFLEKPQTHGIAPCDNIL